ncbi:MAG: hypothetical protein CL927_16920 [Deltaproteobacteria bacterium]|nr:hypothetical protein [Deltaproteobacteria bacterium]HCH61437.1 hypothetical protein [Deltaproteobacteria bacterium]
MFWTRRQMLKASSGALAALTIEPLAWARSNSPAAPKASSNRVALLTGARHYRHFTNVSTATRDAQQLGEILRNTGGYSLVGGGVQHAIRPAAMRDQLKALFAQSVHADRAVFFFSGYVERHPGDRQLYLLPESARIRGPDDLRRQGVGLHDDLLSGAQQAIAANPSLQLIVMIDNYVAPQLWTRFARSPDLELRLDLPARTLLSLAAESHRGAIDAARVGMRSSLYVAELAHQVAHWDRSVEASFSEVGLAVSAATGRQQQPFYRFTAEG